MSRSPALLPTAVWRLLRHSTTIDPYLDESVSAVRRLGAVTLDGISWDALDLSATMALNTEIRTVARSHLRVPCAAIGASRAAVTFTVSVGVEGGVPRRRRLQISGAGYGRWQTIAMNVPAGTIVLSIDVETSADPTSVRPVCGVPTLSWRKSPRAVSRSLGFAVRTLGVAGTLRHVRSRIDADPSGHYAEWRVCHDLDEPRRAQARADAANLTVRPRFAVLLETIEGNEPLASASRASLDAQLYGDWELWPVADVATRNEALARSTADFIAAIRAGDRLAPHALLSVAQRSAADDVDVVYSDEDVWPLGGDRRTPRFKPDWSPELLLSGMYCGRLCVLRRSVAAAVGGFREAAADAPDFDLTLRVAERARQILHVPDVLYHRDSGGSGFTDSAGAGARAALADACARRGLTASVTPAGLDGVWRARISVAERPAVAIVIPTDGRGPGGGAAAFIVHCVRTIRERTRYPNYELLVCDNGNLTAGTLEYLDTVPHSRVTYRWTGSFNFPKKINFAVRQTSAPYVLLLNDDVEPINGEWLDAMLEYAHQTQIGAVGAKLFYPDGRLQHVGVAVGVCGVAAHLLHQHPGGTQGCGGIAVMVRNCAAVTGACLLTRRQVYEEVGGFDEALALDFNDVDFCLRLGRAGYRIVYTPYARLFHHESASFGARRQRPDEVATMRERWGTLLEHDPYYSVNFSREFPDCRIRPCR